MTARYAARIAELRTQADSWRTQGIEDAAREAEQLIRAYEELDAAAANAQEARDLVGSWAPSPDDPAP